MSVLVSCDPGASGSMCCIYDNGKLEFVDFKKEGLTGYIRKLKELLKTNIQIKSAAIEAVYAMRGQGVTSTFTFGCRRGELEGMFQTLEIPYELVRPQEWQKACGVVPKSGKKGIYETISKIYPEAELTGPKGGLLDGRCDALGMAHFLRKTYP